jgi:hypothetical protein
MEVVKRAWSAVSSSVDTRRGIPILSGRSARRIREESVDLQAFNRSHARPASEDRIREF